MRCSPGSLIFQIWNLEAKLFVSCSSHHVHHDAVTNPVATLICWPECHNTTRRQCLTPELRKILGDAISAIASRYTQTGARQRHKADPRVRRSAYADAFGGSAISERDLTIAACFVMDSGNRRTVTSHAIRPGPII